jgi:hypothetical protein
VEAGRHYNAMVGKKLELFLIFLKNFLIPLECSSFPFLEFRNDCH